MMVDTQNQPLNFQYGRTNVINPAAFAGTLPSSDTSSNVGWLTLLGQMLYRYLPVVIPSAEEAVELAATGAEVAGALLLDARDKNKYYQERNLSMSLSDGSPAHKLYSAIRQPLLRRSFKRADGLAALQRSTANQIRRTTVQMAQPDYRVLSDYTVLRDRRRLVQTPHATLFRQAIPQQYVQADQLERARRGVHARILKQNLRATQSPFSNLTDIISQATQQTAGQSTLDGVTSLLYTDTRQIARAKCDMQASHNPFAMDGSVRQGTFFESPIYTASLEPLASNLFGFVEIDKSPMEMVLNSNIAYPRLQISFAHEMLHIMAEMHKFNIPHDVIHELALTIVNEIMPGLQAMAAYTNHEHSSN
jgi:hypothetical protein